MPYKTFLSPGGPATTSFFYLWDPAMPVSGAISNDVIGTGGLRPAMPSDFGGGGGGSTTPVTNSFAILTGSAISLPIGTKSWAFAVISGAAWVNGTGGIDAGYGLSSSSVTANVINIGATGVVAAPAKVIVQWES